MWEELNFFILERVFSYLDSYELFCVVPKVCFSWKNTVKQCLLPQVLNFEFCENFAETCKRERLSDEALHRLFIEFDLSKTLHLNLSNQLKLQDRSLLNVANYSKSLVSINLTGCCNLSDVSLKYLASIVTLQSVTVSLSEITGSSLYFLARLPNLETLQLEKLFRLRLDFLENFLSSYPALKKLVVRHCKLITHDFFLFLVTDVDLPVLEDLILDGLLENRDSVRVMPDLNFEQQPLRFLSIRSLSLYNLIWLQDLQLMAFLRVCSLNRLSVFELVRCNPAIRWGVNLLLSAPNIQHFVLEGNQEIVDRDILDAMFSHRSGIIRNCGNISDQMKRQMARSNSSIIFETTSNF